MKRLTISLTFEFGADEPEPPQREGSADALVEMGNPNPDDRHELDGRRGPLGFRAAIARPSHPQE